MKMRNIPKADRRQLRSNFRKAKKERKKHGIKGNVSFIEKEQKANMSVASVNDSPMIAKAKVVDMIDYVYPGKFTSADLEQW